MIVAANFALATFVSASPFDAVGSCPLGHLSRAASANGCSIEQKDCVCRNKDAILNRCLADISVACGGEAPLISLSSHLLVKSFAQHIVIIGRLTEHMILSY